MDWHKWNQLQISAGKTKELVVGIHRCKHSPPTPVNIQGTDIVMVESYKSLDVQLDDKLDWTNNTNALFKKGRGRLYLLMNLLECTGTRDDFVGLWSAQQDFIYYFF